MDSLFENRHGDRADGPVTEADLHAYVDGQLDERRRALVMAYLARNPQAHAQVRGWTGQNELLRRSLDGVLDEPIPLRFAPPRRKTHLSRLAMAASVLLMALSAVLAWQARGWLDARQASGKSLLAVSDDGLPRRAAVAHLVFASDQGRPVEVGADQEQAMVKWLSRRLGEPLRVPVLQDVGYSLVGGRVLPGARGAVAQLMYGKANGQRLTLYVTHEAQGDPAAFRFVREGAVNVFYWKDGRRGYALSGEVDRDELWRACVAVYRQLDAAQGGPGPG